MDYIKNVACWLLCWYLDINKKKEKKTKGEENLYMYNI